MSDAETPEADHLLQLQLRTGDAKGAGKPGLLGVRPSRQFKPYRMEFPAIFRFNGKLFQEFYDIDEARIIWVEISPEDAEPWLIAKG